MPACPWVPLASWWAAHSWPCAFPSLNSFNIIALQVATMLACISCTFASHCKCLSSHLYILHALGSFPRDNFPFQQEVCSRQW